jgi:hypothetical protein
MHNYGPFPGRYVKSIFSNSFRPAVGTAHTPLHAYKGLFSEDHGGLWVSRHKIAIIHSNPLPRRRICGGAFPLPLTCLLFEHREIFVFTLLKKQYVCQLQNFVSNITSF